MVYWGIGTSLQWRDRKGSKGNELAMRISLLDCGRIVVASVIAFMLLLMCRSAGPADDVDSLIRQLDAPGGNVTQRCTVSPGGPVFEHSAPMRKLVVQGNAMHLRLVTDCKDPQIRNEVALILAEIGDKDALPRLIELLPPKEKLTEEEGFSTMCLLYALWQLTGMELGIRHKFSPEYKPEFRKQWQVWYESNKDYLYSPSAPKLTAYRWAHDRVLVDVEAKLAARSTAAYREHHPWSA